jgi:hypothetical protein
MVTAMNLRSPGTIAIAALGIAVLFIPGRGLMTPAAWFFRSHHALLIPMAAVIFCVVYFGTLKFWELLTGSRLQKPFPAILALWLGIRLSVDCARMLMWW